MILALAYPVRSEPPLNVQYPVCKPYGFKVDTGG